MKGLIGKSPMNISYLSIQLQKLKTKISIYTNC